MMEQRKDIFGNVYTINTQDRKPMSYAQKLREAQAKQKLRMLQAEQRKQQIASIKKVAGRTAQGSKKLGGLVKKGYGRATDSRLTSIREKLRGSIYKKE